jgi:hypothetical protein
LFKAPPNYFEKNITHVFWSLYVEQLFFKKGREDTTFGKKTSVMRQHLMCFKVGVPRENGNNFHLTLENY